MKLLSGNEKINCGGKDTGKTLLDFWQWNSSDLLNNKTARKENIEGWFSLKGVKNGGGYLNDKGI